MSKPGDLAACRALLANGSKTFYAASFLLPKKIRDAATALYAFCRLADDAVDLDTDPITGLAVLRERLDRAYDGRPADHPADRAFADTVSRFAVPKAIPEGLLEGFEWDALGRRYQSFSELEAYAARVAGTVGAMMALLMGERRPEVVARACDLGIAMQLTNIARDVGEDARAGRLYLPRDWLTDVGIDAEDFMRAPRMTEGLAVVLARLLAVADHHYQRAEAGIAELPLSCRPGIFAARLLYAEIGREIERRGYDSVTGRAFVSKTRKLALLGAALSRAAAPASKDYSAAPAGALFLIDAVAHAEAPPRYSRLDAPPWWDLHGRWARVIEMLHDLEMRDANPNSEQSFASPRHQSHAIRS